MEIKIFPRFQATRPTRVRNFHGVSKLSIYRIRGHYYICNRQMTVVSTIDLSADLTPCQLCGQIVYLPAENRHLHIRIPADLYKKLGQKKIQPVEFGEICPPFQSYSSHTITCERLYPIQPRSYIPFLYQQLPYSSMMNGLSGLYLKIPKIQRPADYSQSQVDEFKEELLSTMETDWRLALRDEFCKFYFTELCRGLFEDIKFQKMDVYPPLELVFSWTKTQIKDVKVVIIGQDPYFKPGQANGLCFSVSNGMSVPQSLLTIYNELESDIPTFKRPVYVDNVPMYNIPGDIAHGDLTGWARQGVLLLNSILTVRGGLPNSHKNYGWEKFTDAVIQLLSRKNPKAVFMLWGKSAQKKCEDISEHHVLWAPHPASRSGGFPGCKHFSRCNLLLQFQGLEPIDWGYLPIDA